MIIVKVHYKNEIRRISFEEPTVSFTTLVSTLEYILHVERGQLVIKYLDEDQEKVTISNEGDLNEALGEYGKHCKNLLKLFVAWNPSDQLKEGSDSKSTSELPDHQKNCLNELIASRKVAPDNPLRNPCSCNQVLLQELKQENQSLKQQQQNQTQLLEEAQKKIKELQKYIEDHSISPVPNQPIANPPSIYGDSLLQRIRSGSGTHPSSKYNLYNNIHNNSNGNSNTTSYISTHLNAELEGMVKREFSALLQRS